MATLEATLAQVRTRRREVDWTRVALALAFALPWLIGWTVRKTVVVLGVIASFVWAAADVGWRAAAPKDKGGD
ncbi:hypothetical protein [Actinokineospora sp. UTMC 2448]|uniref:hypothetical protein n=1 Tax=Actinokineospora sp. UTMC 2448 TaxID=2268449 RepID=UPI0021640A65|nr:hypothetical protein [Actinokineospora sp. UTMC 2448]UVS81834.1 hypothetical protein Actkin_05598 [Actinokineospora sp. UTMC 2448]